MYAPQFDNYIWGLGISHRGYNSGDVYTDEAYPIIDEIMALLKQITPCYENGCRELWFCVERGPIEAYGNYEEQLEDGDVENYEEFVSNWERDYPDDEKWYRFYGLETDEKYQAISINYNCVIEVSPYKERNGFPYDVTEFVSFIKDKVMFCIQQIKDGIYMDYIRPRIPDTHKTGTILQRYLWEIYPESKTSYFDGITDADIEDFFTYMSQQDHKDYKPKQRLSHMTANDFYRYCAIGYKAMGYDGCELPLRKQYEKHADGRDEGLEDIDPTSPEAFREWLVEGRKRGGHPWEVCRGGNSTHIALYVGLDDDGYYLRLAGSSYGRSAETIKFYLALRRNGVPVYLSDGDHLAERVRGEEKVGIVPQGIIPKYRHSDFPNEDIISFSNLPYENPEVVASRCVWQEIKEVKLIEEGCNG